MKPRNLLTAFSDWRNESRELVLASVYETAGSTYSKAGARMLITSDGRFHGMLSGGCLEGDLAERAAAVSRSGTPQTVTYDLGRNDEALWGLGVGCDGLMRIFLQALTADTDYQPFAAMADVYAGNSPGIAVTVIESGHDVLRPGATFVQVDDLTRTFGIDLKYLPQFADDMERVKTLRTSRAVDLTLDCAPVRLLFALLQPPPRILTLGGGLDAEPVVRLMAELGWRVVVQDHRPAYIANGDFSAAERVMNVPVPELGPELDLAQFDAAIVMSHHLHTDRAYLELLAGSTIPYIGLLGPIDRRRRLLDDLGGAAGKLAGRLHGPAGLDIGGRGPASIALSIVAEIHGTLMRE
jgi:xanthine/CO dehydrogenase XdhC/CoxF family maturation factor